MIEIVKKNLEQYLQTVYLNGLVNEFVIETDNEGISTTKAVDMSSCIFILLSKKINLPVNTEFGIRTTSQLLKYLSMIKTDTINCKITKNTAEFYNNKEGKFKISLLNKEVVPTFISNTVEEIKEKLSIGNEVCKISLTKDEVQKCLSYIGLCNIETLNIIIENNKIIFKGNDKEQSEFELSIGQIVKGENEKICVYTYSKYFTTILNNLTQNNDKVVFSLSNDNPLVFYTENNLLSLTTLNI